MPAESLPNVEIWHIPTTKNSLMSQQLFMQLSVDEQLRARQIHDPIQKNTYITSHAALRNIIASHLNIAIEEINLVNNKEGKPLLGNDPSFFFNLSHTHHYALLGLSNHCQIGIDIEFVNQKRDALAIAKRFFSQDEYEWLIQIEPSQQIPCFYQLWCHKEAYLKGIGTGLQGGLSTFTLSCKDLHESCIIPDQKNNQWKLDAIDVPSPYKAALSVNCTEHLIKIQHWQADV